MPTNKLLTPNGKKQIFFFVIISYTKRGNAYTLVWIIMRLRLMDWSNFKKPREWAAQSLFFGDANSAIYKSIYMHILLGIKIIIAGRARAADLEFYFFTRINE